MTAGCEARQQSDQMRCDRCDLLWDMNDEDPPVCKSAHDLAIDAIRQNLKPDRACSCPH